MKIHIVQKGDTLWKIAKKYGVNFEELKKMNSQLSNPDMIMPGMKVKVPTTGGMIKKEAPMGTKPENAINLGVKKEMPIAEHPFVKEKPVPMPNVVPKKEVPIIKEAPKVPYIPKQPLQVVPEIDINNYYMMNMANMTVPQPQLPPKPANILPEVKEVPKKEIPIKEVPVAPVMPAKELPNVIPAPVVKQPEYCVPVTPIMPGPGFCPPFGGYPVQPFMPFPQVQGAEYPVTPGYMPMTPGCGPEEPGYMPATPGYAPEISENMPGPVGYTSGGPGYMPATTGYTSAAPGFMPSVAPTVAGASYMPQHFDDESSSFMPQMPVMNPAYNPGAVMGGQNPAFQQSMQTPYMEPVAPGVGYEQVPTGYLGTAPGGYPTGYPGTPAGYPGTPAGYPGTPAGYPGTPAGYPGTPAGYPGTPAGYPGIPAGYPGTPAGYPGTPAGYSGGPAGYPGTPMGYPGGPAGYPRTPMGYPGGPTGYQTEQYPGEFAPATSMAGAGYVNPAIGVPYAADAPYGQDTYGYPQMGGPGSTGIEGLPVGTGTLGDCGCGPTVPMVESVPNKVPSVVPNNVPSNFVPSTPPVYSAPYTGPVNVAQPPFMNPYGMGPVGASPYGMPRYDDESNEYGR